MTRRTRLENKLAKREEWADKAAARAEQAFNTSHTMADAIPFGQPILGGHHSEGRDRRYRERMIAKGFKGVEETKLAEHHAQAAKGIAQQLDRSIFSDDDNAIEALAARIAEREEASARMKAINAAFRKVEGDDNTEKLIALLRSGVVTDEEAKGIATTFRYQSWAKQPYPSYALAGVRQAIGIDKERMEEIKRRQAKAAEAEAAPNGVTFKTQPGYDFTERKDVVDYYLTITFAEKPDYALIRSLKDAGFRWSRGSWSGTTSKLPPSVAALRGE